jgi:transposase-like protein
VKTTAGSVVLERPKVRGTSQPFTSRLLGTGVSRSNALEALVISGFVRGLSVRDVEAALAEALGPEAALSKWPEVRHGSPGQFWMAAKARQASTRSTVVASAIRVI